MHKLIVIFHDFRICYKHNKVVLFWFFFCLLCFHVLLKKPLLSYFCEVTLLVITPDAVGGPFNPPV